MDLPRQPLRGLSRGARLLVLLAASAGCGGEGGQDPYTRGRRWLEDPVLRRDVLEDALVRWDNGYAALRLERYTEADWGARPAWRPQIAPARTSTVPPADFEAAVPEGFVDEASLVALGEAAFRRYPVQVVPELRSRIRRPAASRSRAGACAGWSGWSFPTGRNPR